jgi:hypothetical protein
MIRARVHFAFPASADDIPRTILVVAKKRAAAMNALLLIRFGGIERQIGTLRIYGDAAFVGESLVIIGPIPIAAPLPNVFGHVVKAISIRWKTFHWRDPSETIFAGIFDRKFSLSGVCHPFAVRPKFVSPNVGFSRKSAARREFELRFRR